MILKGFAALLLIVLVLALCSVACGQPPEWVEWQNEVNQRQREGLATDVPTATPKGE